MSGLRSSWLLALRRRALVGRALDLLRSRRRRVYFLHELDLGLLEEAVELLDVGLVQIEVGGGGGYLRVSEDPDLLPLGEQVLDLFELLQFDH